MSLDNQNWPSDTLYFDSAAKLTLRVVASMTADPLPVGVVINLNVPNRPLEEIASVEVCGLGRRHYDPVVEERIAPRSRAYYWIGGEPVSGEMSERTDGWWLNRGHAAITVLGLDNTAYSHLAHLKRWAINPTTGN